MWCIAAEIRYMHIVGQDSGVHHANGLVIICGRRRHCRPASHWRRRTCDSSVVRRLRCCCSRE